MLDLCRFISTAPRLLCGYLLELSGRYSSECRMSSAYFLKSVDVSEKRIKKYADLLPDEKRRLRALEDENNRLMKIVAEPTLDPEMLHVAIRRKL